MRFRRKRARLRSFIAVLSVLAGTATSGCATCEVWRAAGDGYFLVESRSRYASGSPTVMDEVGNSVAAVLLTPFSLAIDVVACPWQVANGYRPYGDRQWGD